MKPLVAITMGDPAGVGAEISLKAASSTQLSDMARILILGSGPVLEYYRKLLKISFPLKEIKTPEQYEEGYINFISVNKLSLSDFEAGKVSPVCGRAAYEYLEVGVKLALEGKISAIATAPINKEALHKAGLDYSGHTEILARLTGAADYAMMLVSGTLRIIHVSTHVALKKACELVKKERVYKVIKLADKAVKALGIPAPRIAVAGLNPHAGEGGLFGREEREEIRPGIEKAREEGVQVSGPLPPDTVFLKAYKGHYDAVVAMYHDQGHIPVKILGFETGVNITVGLPIIRTSVDHGTAFDIAGRGIADERSMVEAVKIAVKLNQGCRKVTVTG
ncbi:4-hydroxythreonine-4-phosphate dehydrogenase PdxA [Desulfofundulus salinus]|uniref:4-hydroxythreonine-4-phosphate dehydrogenase PdxA n=1 Tax=Desulfofundulus salinus TaxID=2419843 RepID=A0A494WUJ7_9FIRM|nr:4-hydroxythreonine-4-phosphate dehydrogenase PdxA [Desulfofundulus salinum]RKO65792.1 4-hydroxythreonine-4-phosphate dehydrogenase PdxA [Desulfofundulus salinum]